MYQKTKLIGCICIAVSVKIIAQKDSTKLPFIIADEKKLSEEDLTHKREGFYVTGVPQLSSDPVNGFGYGAEGFMYFNGKKSDPLFAYTPYRKKISLSVFNTTKMQNEVVLGLDVPYIFNSKWRLRVEGIYENDPNMLYFGVSEKSLQALVGPQNGLAYPSYQAYDNSLSGVYKNYNRFTEKNNVVLNVSGEYSFFQGKMRSIVGYRVAHMNVNPYAGASLLQDDYTKNRAYGVGHSFVTMLQSGIVYDTRDLESDPNQGVFAEFTNELSTNVLGSQFTFDKMLLHVKAYRRLFPKTFKKVILCARAGISGLAGNAPFYEFQEVWSSEGGIYGVNGGGFVLRGYKQSRFVASCINFANVEIRARFVQFKALKQHIALSFVPFFDIAGTGNTLSRLLGYSANYRYAEGLGLRIAWNVNTILRFDYAFSQEDRQFFFQFGHAF
ncbi:MAG: BamA/TamA family outer membrane protein [Bacteroidetes bacterium]|nr:BamA/TamA family outer membrane protein [Bacteroidota bacterium]